MCDFPTHRLLQRRREVLDMHPPEIAVEIIRAIDEARWRHEERTGCHCWDEALKANPNPLAKEAA
jgi:hypothetical protein